MPPLSPAPAQTSLARFRATLRREGKGLIEALRHGQIGEGAMIPGPFGPRALIYADHIASGRALRQVEDFVAAEILPLYANSHTEASYCGAFMTRLRAEARQAIAAHTGADDSCAVIFAGAGATAGLNRLVHLLGLPAAVAEGRRPVVFLGPYEHHSNILPWRESGAEVIEIGESAAGGPDLDALAAALHQTEGRSLRIGSFSAMSNVTGICTDTDAVTTLLRAHGVLAVWDYAGGAPYLPMDMGAEGSPAAKDAIVFSPHKFSGGPGASGVLVLRRAAVRSTVPAQPGGGTVAFVSPWAQDYSSSVIAREEAGTPNVLGDIRAALAVIVKEAVGTDFIARRHQALNRAALTAWRRHPRIEILGNAEANRVPVFSLRIRDGAGGHVHQQLFTRMLSDHYGIQARGGCACAGPYAHRLLGIGQEASEVLRQRLLDGEEELKPGWTRLNFSYLLEDAKAARILDSVAALADAAAALAEDYRIDPATARFNLRPDLPRLARTVHR